MAEEVVGVVIDLRPRLSQRSAERLAEAMRRHPSQQEPPAERRACVVTPLRPR
jgi:hypothetical protein